MEYIFILCSNDPERRADINQLIKDFNELVYRKYPDCVILNVEVYNCCLYEKYQLTEEEYNKIKKALEVNKNE